MKTLATLILLLLTNVEAAPQEIEIRTTCSTSDQRFFLSEKRLKGRISATPEKLTLDGALPAPGVFASMRDDKKVITPKLRRVWDDNGKMTTLYTVSFVLIKYPSENDPPNAVETEIYRDTALCKETRRKCTDCGDLEVTRTAE